MAPRRSDVRHVRVPLRDLVFRLVGRSTRRRVQQIVTITARRGLGRGVRR